MITVEQCQRALSYLGYAQSLVNLDNLQKIIAAQREALYPLTNDKCSTNSTDTFSSSKTSSSPSTSSPSSSSLLCAQSNAKNSSSSATANCEQSEMLDFNLFCVISAYLSVLQQEIHESGCISPIKGTNVPPPPVYLSNLQGKLDAKIKY